MSAPTSIFEKTNSRLGDDKRETRFYDVRGPVTEAQAKVELLAHVNAGVPELDPDLHLDSINLAKVHRDGFYLFEVRWLTAEGRREAGEPEEPLQENEFALVFDTSGNIARITQSLKTQAYDASGRNTVLDSLFGGAINVTGSGDQMRAEGVDVTIPSFKFQLRYSLAASRITMSYVMVVAGLTGYVNNSPFPPRRMPWIDVQLEPGTTQFLGLTGSVVTSGRTELLFGFDGKPNVTLEIEPFGQIPKLGQEFIWFRYAPQDDAVAKKTVLKPIIAFVEQPSPFGDLNALLNA